jgi:hypothetical protein
MAFELVGFVEGLGRVSVLAVGTAVGLDSVETEHGLLQYYRNIWS